MILNLISELGMHGVFNLLVVQIGSYIKSIRCLFVKPNWIGYPMCVYAANLRGYSKVYESNCGV